MSTQFAKLGIQYVRDQNNALERRVIFSDMGMIGNAILYGEQLQNVPCTTNDDPSTTSRFNQILVPPASGIYPGQSLVPVKHLMTPYSDDTSFMTAGMSVANVSSLTDIPDAGINVISRNILEMVFACPTKRGCATGVRLRFSNSTYTIRLAYNTSGTEITIKLFKDGVSSALVTGYVFNPTENEIIDLCFSKKCGDLYLEYKESGYTSKSSYQPTQGSRDSGVLKSVGRINITKVSGTQFSEFVSTYGNSLSISDSFVITHLIGDGGAGSNWGKYFIFDLDGSTIQAPSEFVWETVAASSGTGTHNNWIIIRDGIQGLTFQTRASGWVMGPGGGSYPTASFSNKTLTTTQATLASAGSSDSSGLHSSIMEGYIDTSVGVKILAYASLTRTSTSYYNASYSISIDQYVPVPVAVPEATWTVVASNITVQTNSNNSWQDVSGVNISSLYPVRVSGDLDLGGDVYGSYSNLTLPYEGSEATYTLNLGWGGSDYTDITINFRINDGKLQVSGQSIDTSGGSVIATNGTHSINIVVEQQGYNISTWHTIWEGDITISGSSYSGSVTVNTNASTSYKYRISGTTTGTSPEAKTSAETQGAASITWSGSESSPGHMVEIWDCELGVVANDTTTMSVTKSFSSMPSGTASAPTVSLTKIEAYY